MGERPSQNAAPGEAGGSLRLIAGSGQLTLAFSGRLDAASVAELWPQAFGALRPPDAAVRRVIVDASAVTYCDGAGLGLFVGIQREFHRSPITVEVQGLQESTQRLLAMLPVEKFFDTGEARSNASAVQRVGVVTVDVVRSIHDAVGFLGELCAEAVRTVVHQRKFRFTDALHTVEIAGVNAIPILLLLSFLFGLILAFQSVGPLRKFGVEVYVADLLSVALTREMGPLLMAIILAGRSGSAFAAELGTMRVREEIDALRTMGLSPVRFLALPRVAAGAFVAPLLAIISILAALVGGALVICGMGYPLVVYVDHVLEASSYVDLIGGLCKAVVFGVLVSGIGCMEGLRTGTGPSAVGASTTRAVVAGLVLIIVADGVFAVLFNILGI